MELVVEGLQGLGNLGRELHEEHEWGVDLCSFGGPGTHCGREAAAGNVLKGLITTPTVRGNARELDLRLDVQLVEDSRIGSGAFGSVVKGVYNRAQVAVKLAHTGASLKTFQNELEAFAKCPPHDNVVYCYGANLDPHNSLGAVYLVEELMERSLADLIYDGDCMRNCTHSTLLNIFLDVARGMCHLHSVGLHHCNLKPANILLDKYCRAKVCDLGLSGLTSMCRGATVCRGTPGYMAFEVLFSCHLGEQVLDARKIDVFAFGVVMWEAITGCNPSDPFSEASFTGESQDSMHGNCEASTSGGCLDVDNANVMKYPFDCSCPEELKALIWDCTKFAFQDRPTFQEVVGRLEGFLQSSWISTTVRNPN